MVGGGGSDVLRQKSLAQRAEEIRRQRTAFEATKGKIDHAVQLTKDLGIEFPGLSDREAEIDKAATPTKMAEADKLGQALLLDVTTLVQENLKGRLENLSMRIGELVKIGIPEASGMQESQEAGKKNLAEGALGDCINTTKTLDKSLTELENKSTGLLRSRVEEVLKWAFPDGGIDDAKAAIAKCYELLDKEDAKGASEYLESSYKEKVPQVENKLLSLADSLGKSIPVAKTLGIQTEEYENILASIPDAHFLTSDLIAHKLDDGSTRLWGAITPRLFDRLEKLKAVLDHMKTKEVDVTDSLREIDSVERQLGKIPPQEAVARLDAIDTMVEGPLLRLVFAEVEEMRPYLEEARSLGRPIAPVLDGMNETRKLLNSKDYLRAFQVSSETLDKARRLMEDVDIARSEIEEFKALLFRLEVVGLNVTDLQSHAIKADELAGKGDFNAAKDALREGAKLLGKHATQFFDGQISSLEHCIELLEARRVKLPEDLKGRVEQSRVLLSSSNIPGVLEAVSDANAKIQAVVKSFISERVEQMRADFDAVLDESVRKYLENSLAGVSSTTERVDQAISSLMALQSVEHEVTVTMANEVGKGLTGLEDRQKSLEKMGVGAEETAHEVSQVKQILDTGDYVRALRSLSDVSNRITQAAMGRAEDALTGAKLALVDVTKSISEPPEVRQLQDKARDEFQSGNYLGAYESATRAKESALAIQARAQKIVDKIGQMVTSITTLRKKGSPVEDLRQITTRIAGVREHYQELKFEQAEETLVEIQSAIEKLSARTSGLVGTVILKKVIEGSSGLGVYTTEWTDKLEKLSEGLKGDEPEKVAKAIEDLTTEVVDKIRPVLEEDVKTVESELRAARDEGLDIREAEGLFRDAVEKLKAPIPVGAATALIEVKKQFSENRVVQEAAQKGIALARDIVGQAEMMNIEVISFQAKIDDASNKMAASDYGAALGLAQDVKVEALGKVKDHLNQLIANLQNVILRVKRDGALTMVAENYIAQARNKIASGNTGEVLQLLGKAENELERVELQHSIAQNSLANIEGKIEAVAKSGIRSQEIASEVAEARRSFEDGEYAKVMEIVLKVSDDIQRSEEMFRRAEASSGRAKSILEAASAVGCDVGTISMEDVRAAMDAGRYAEAEALSHAAWDNAREILEKDLSSRLKDLASFIELIGSDVQRGQALSSALEEARKSKTKEEYTSMARALDTAVMVVVNATGEFLRAQEGRLSGLEKSVPADQLKEPRELIDVISDDMRMGNLQTLSGNWSKLRSMIDSVVLDYVNSCADKLAENAFTIERVGADGGPVVEKVSEARTALADGNSELAMKRLDEAREAMDTALRGVLPEQVKSIKVGIQRAVGMNVSVAGMDVLVADVENFAASGNLLAAAGAMIEAEQALSRRKNWQKELQEAQFLVDSLMDQASSNDIDTSHAGQLVDNAINLKAEGDYQKALAAVEEAKKELRRLLKLD